MKLTDIEYDFNVDKLSVLQNHRILKYQKKKKKNYFPCFIFPIPLWSHYNWKESLSKTNSLIHSLFIYRTFIMYHGIMKEWKHVLAIMTFVS